MMSSPFSRCQELEMSDCNQKANTMSRRTTSGTQRAFCNHISLIVRAVRSKQSFRKHTANDRVQVAYWQCQTRRSSTTDFPINTSIEVVRNSKATLKGEEEDIARRAHVGTRLHDDD
jgi:hypothetical protein